MPKTLYLNFFGKIVSVIFDDKIAKTITLESSDQNALTTVRNGIINELSNGQPVNIKYAVFVEIQVNILIDLRNILCFLKCIIFLETTLFTRKIIK